MTRHLLRPLLLCAGLLLASGLPAAAANIKLLTTGAYRPVAQDLIQSYEKRTGNTVTMESDTAGAVLRRLQKGETFDVIILTSDGMDALADLGTVAADSVVPLAKVGIGVAVALSAPQPDLGSVEAFRKTLLSAGHIAYLDPASGSSSAKAMVAIFAKLGVTEQMSRKAILLEGGNAADPVAHGKADLAFQQASELKLVPTVRFAGLLPQAIQIYTIYSGALSAATPQKAAAKALLATFASRNNAALLESLSLEAP